MCEHCESDLNEKMMTKQDVKDHLLKHNSFRMIAEETMLCTEDHGKDLGTDVIVVAFRDGVVLITGDGISVWPSWKIIPMNGSEYFWNMVLHEVLHMF